jgi:hypothetical protein
MNSVTENEMNKKKWITVNIPHYCRQPIETIMDIQQICKISFSLSGAGMACFRHAESPVNAVMLMQDTPLAWSINWENGVNCIKATEGHEIQNAAIALKMENLLYDIYVAGIDTCDKYRLNRYCKEYIEPILKRL